MMLIIHLFPQHYHLKVMQCDYPVSISVSGHPQTSETLPNAVAINAVPCHQRRASGWII